MTAEKIYYSVARTAAPTIKEMTKTEAELYAEIVIDCTADPAAASVVFNVENLDPASGKYNLVLASAAIAAVGTTRLLIGPALTASANVIANDFLAKHWRVRPVHADADSITYSVGVNLT